MSPEDATKLVADLQALRQQLTKWRYGLPLAILAIVLISVLRIYNAAEALAREGPVREDYVARVTEGLEQDVYPVVKSVAYQTLSETRSAAQNEFERIGQRTPEFARVSSREADLLIANISSRSRLILEQTIGAAFRKREGKIRQMFPEADEARVTELVNQLVEAAETQADHVADRLFLNHLESIHDLLADLGHIRATEPDASGKSMASWDMALVIFDLLRDELDGLALADAPSEQSAPSVPSVPTSKASVP